MVDYQVRKTALIDGVRRQPGDVLHDPYNAPQIVRLGYVVVIEAPDTEEAVASDLHALKRPQLLEIAADLGIEKPGALRKNDDLIAAIEAAQATRGAGDVAEGDGTGESLPELPDDAYPKGAEAMEPAHDDDSGVEGEGE